MKESPIQLPPPRLKGRVSIEEAIYQRRTHRTYKNRPITIEEISQLLFVGQGITNKEGGRTVPSAGALYPIEMYLVAGNVKGIAPGAYKYKPETHELIKVLDGDKRKELSEATLFQFWVEDAAAVIVLCGVFWRTMIKYRERGKYFVFMEMGHTAQNISLQSIPLGLGTVCIGGFNKRKVKRILNLRGDEVPLYLLPIGKIFKNYYKKERETMKKFKHLLEEVFSRYSRNHE